MVGTKHTGRLVSGRGASENRGMRLTTHRSLGERLATSVVGALVGAAAGLTAGLSLALVLTLVIDAAGRMDDEGWGFIVLCIAGAFVGTVAGAAVGVVLGYRRRPIPRVPPRPDA